MLGYDDIIREVKEGGISIDPFNEAQVNPNSYDVRLGKWFYRVQWRDRQPWFIGPYEAQPGEEIEVPTGGTLLAMTAEIIGSFDDIAGKVFAKSSEGRAGKKACRDAGLGDVGYHNHWTLELEGSVSGENPIVVVGEPIAQIVFFRAESPVSKPYTGQYNIKDWPLCMVPKKWRGNILPWRTFG